jgi:hypothetical protein
MGRGAQKFIFSFDTDTIVAAIGQQETRSLRSLLSEASKCATALEA